MKKRNTDNTQSAREHEASIADKELSREAEDEFIQDYGDDIPLEIDEKYIYTPSAAKRKWIRLIVILSLVAVILLSGGLLWANAEGCFLPADKEPEALRDKDLSYVSTSFYLIGKNYGVTPPDVTMYSSHGIDCRRYYMTLRAAHGEFRQINAYLSINVYEIINTAAGDAVAKIYIILDNRYTTGFIEASADFEQVENGVYIGTYEGAAWCRFRIGDNTYYVTAASMAGLEEFIGNAF